MQQNIPANDTVVNFGVSLLHLKETEKTEKPNAEAKPNIKPFKDPNEALSKAITAIPIAAINIAIQTPSEIFSLKNKNPSNAVMNGMAAKHNNVIAAVV